MDVMIEDISVGEEISCDPDEERFSVGEEEESKE
jgi:hypothetical protein